MQLLQNMPVSLESMQKAQPHQESHLFALMKGNCVHGVNLCTLKDQDAVFMQMQG